MYKAEYSDVYTIPPMPLQYVRIMGRIPHPPTGVGLFRWWISSASFRLSKSTESTWVITGNVPRNDSDQPAGPLADPDIMYPTWAYEIIAPYLGQGCYPDPDTRVLDQETPDGRIQLTFHRTPNVDNTPILQEAFWIETGTEHEVELELQINVYLMTADGNNTGEVLSVNPNYQPGDPGDNDFPFPPWYIMVP